MYVRKNGGETVCSTKTQVIDYDLFFWLHNILRHILPHIKIRVAGAVSPSDLDLIDGGGAWCGAFLLTLKHFYSCFCTFTIQGVTVFASTSKIDLPV